MRTMRTVALCLLLTAAACPGTGERAAEGPSEELTRRQKDSIVSTLPVPGSRGVGRAMEAQDAAAERARRLEEESKR